MDLVWAISEAAQLQRALDYCNQVATQYQAYVASPDYMRATALVSQHLEVGIRIAR